MTAARAKTKADLTREVALRANISARDVDRVIETLARSSLTNSRRTAPA